jgi:hypothetical protein
MLARMHQADPEVRVVAVADPDAAGAKNSLHTAGAPAEDARFFSDEDGL